MTFVSHLTNYSFTLTYFRFLCFHILNLNYEKFPNYTHKIPSTCYKTIRVYFGVLQASAEAYWALRGTREGGHNCISVGATIEFIMCHEVFHVSMLWKYTPHPAHIVDWGGIIVDTDETFEEGPACILDNRNQVL